jgi:hypothetical protein
MHDITDALFRYQSVAWIKIIWIRIPRLVRCSVDWLRAGPERRPRKSVRPFFAECDETINPDDTPIDMARRRFLVRQDDLEDR